MNTQHDLRQEVADLIADVATTHRYSMSRIYNLSNRVFSKHEKPQSCASCLIRKVKELTKWLESQPSETEVVEVEMVQKRKSAKRKA